MGYTVTVILSLLLLCCASKTYTSRIITFGNITVDITKKEIRFMGKVTKDKGWQQFLIYVHGYKWLKEKSAIVSEAKLVDLQQAIAALDWRLWNDIYIKNIQSRDLSLFIEYNNCRVSSEKLIVSDDKLSFQDLVFIGSTYFDAAVLGNPPELSCDRCPIYNLEQEILNKKFIRKSNKTGYVVKNMPPVGTEVTIIIKL